MLSASLHLVGLVFSHGWAYRHRPSCPRRPRRRTACCVHVPASRAVHWAPWSLCPRSRPPLAACGAAPRCVGASSCPQRLLSLPCVVARAAWRPRRCAALPTASSQLEPLRGDFAAAVLIARAAHGFSRRSAVAFAFLTAARCRPAVCSSSRPRRPYSSSWPLLTAIGARLFAYCTWLIAFDFDAQFAASAPRLLHSAHRLLCSALRLRCSAHRLRRSAHRRRRSAHRLLGSAHCLLRPAHRLLYSARHLRRPAHRLRCSARRFSDQAHHFRSLALRL